jgi:replicative DNA helicase
VAIPHSPNILEFPKEPPHSIEAEQSVLGGLIRESTLWPSVADRLIEADFFLPKHHTIFKFIKALHDEGYPCDIVTLAERLERYGKLEVVGSLSYLAQLVRNTPDTSNIVTYADIVRERSLLRQLMRAGNDITNSVFEQGTQISELLDRAEKLIFTITEQGGRNLNGFTEVKDALAQTLDRIDVLYRSDSKITGLATGFSDFDDKTSGLQRSDLIIIAGRPSMGKTSFALNIAEYVAIKHHLPVAVFSMEMSNEQLVMRLISSLARINLQSVRTGKLQDDDWNRMTPVIAQLEKTPLFIDETPALNPTELRARARRLKHEQGQLGLIVIDYLQLMQVPHTKENRATEVSEISRSLKILAKELDVPVVALSQLNRNLELRSDKRPQMADLRESGSLEQDADLIAFIYRDEVYNDNSPDKGVAEIIIAKQRNGPIGTTRLTFLGQYTRFENYIEDAHSF